jgi:predicted nucleic acid-binding protein
MLSSSVPLVYWDACVFLEYINDVDVARVSHIQGMMLDSNIQIVTSILSIVEVAKGKIEQDGNAVDAATEAKINKLWEVGSPIEVIEFYELIAEDAKKLMRAAIPHGYSLKAGDAIHLATADRLKVSEFHTYDNLAKYFQFTNTRFPIVEPVANQAVIVSAP